MSNRNDRMIELVRLLLLDGYLFSKETCVDFRVLAAWRLKKFCKASANIYIPNDADL